MIIKQFYLSCLAHASYIIVDERTKTAAVIDPQRDIEQYLDEAEKLGATIKYVLLTHFHADFVAGHLELRDRVGARIYLGASAEAEYDYTPLKDGDALEYGDVRLRVLETPGHTPEGISIVAFDLTKSAETPEAVFTGDTLFVGDVGRPDLMASIGVTADELASALYDSLRLKLMALPDETLVYPAHGAGSMCGKNLGKETFSTIGEQRRTNYALQPMSREEFKAVVTEEQPEAPAYFSHDAVMNKSDRVTLDRNLDRVLRALTLDEVLEEHGSGALLLDVRDPADFAGAHLAGSINIGLNGKFATWAGTLIHPKEKIVIVAEPGTEREAAMRLGRIGLDQVAGYLDGGMGALRSRPELERSIERLTAPGLGERLAEKAPPLVLDVRTDGEREAGRIEGSLHIPLPHLAARVKEIPRDRELAVVCAGGYRSSIAVSLLLGCGFTELADVIGGMDAWGASQLPTAGAGGSACSLSATL
ncbi:Beta-lactamase hydrolase-like protein [Planctomycetes bacterium Poly30]|uniref:Beta-lactamase hydrolase-like protein n=1 Tax=Saltatorellus ferox TaxID=2528018 RepID=A0A518ENT8_9BACT|nr:Beta-lactamase hydrolase-like protein [Planctomycetes bacterium Poly30]